MNVSRFITLQPEPNRGKMTVLRSLALDLGGHTEEKISNKIPLCHLNPTDDCVEPELTKGYEFSDDDRILESRGRKMMKSVTFFSLTSLEEQEETIRPILNGAAILNEYRFKRKANQKK